MNTQENYKPVENSMALTIRKEYRLVIIKNALKTTFRISYKSLLYAMFLIFVNIII